MSRTLLPEHEAQIDEIVEFGAYESADAVIADALRLLNERLHTEDLWRKLEVGIRQIEEGNSIVWTPEWSAERLEIAKQRLANGETPNPDVWP